MRPQDPDYDEIMSGDEEEDEEDELVEDDPNVFKIRNPIPKNTARNLTTKDLHAMIHDGDIDLCPVYQRDEVWSQPKQMAMIDSLWTNLYIPPVLFSVRTNEEGDDIRACIDGKQRLTSIMRFLDGQIPYKDPVTKKLWWYTTSDKTKTSRNQIPSEARGSFCDRTITCVEYSNLTQEQEREIFQRVQMGMPLTAAEKLQAVSSPLAIWITELNAKYISIDGGLTALINVDTKRSRDFQNLASLVYCCEGLPNDQRFATSTKISGWITRREGPSKQLKQTVEKTLEDFVTLAADKRFNQAFRSIEKRVAPVEFVFIGILLCQMHSEARHAKGVALNTFRRTVMANFKDVRHNGPTVKVFWDWIDQLIEDPHSPIEVEEAVKARPVKAGKGKKRNIEEVNEDASPSHAGPSSKTRTTRPRTS